MLDPLYDKFQRWKAGELDHADIDKAIHQTHKLTQELVEDMATGRFLAEQMAHLTTTTRTASDQAEDLRDMGTNDLFIEVVRGLDKWLWFLEAHLQV